MLRNFLTFTKGIVKQNIIFTQFLLVFTGVCIVRPAVICLAPGVGPRSWPSIYIYRPWSLICIYLPWLPICIYQPWAPVCIYRLWLPIRIYQPWLPICIHQPRPPICIYRPWPTILLLVRGLKFAYTDLVYSICTCSYGPGLRFVLLVGGLNLHLPYYW